MGTSKSSDGPKAQPFVPDYASPPQRREPTTEENHNEDSNDTAQSTEEEPQAVLPSEITKPKKEIATSRRFSGTRSALGRFAKTGDRSEIKRALGHYVKKGYGGTANSVARQGHVITSLGRLNSVLGGIGDGTDNDPLNGMQLSQIKPHQLIELIINAVTPVDGTQDAELERSCLSEALSDVLKQDESADLAALSDIQRTDVIRNTLARCVSSRFMLDVGKHLREKAGSARVGAARIAEVRDYIREEVASRFNSMAPAVMPSGSAAFRSIVNNALRETFEVFRSWVS